MSWIVKNIFSPKKKQSTEHRITTLASNSVNKGNGKTTIKIVIEHLLAMNALAFSSSPASSPASPSDNFSTTSKVTLTTVLSSLTPARKLASSLDTKSEKSFVEALITAVESGKLKNIDALHPYPDGSCSLLHKAAKQGFAHAVEKLITEYGAQVDIVDSTDATPLFYACAKGSASVASALIRHGAKVNYKDSYFNFPLLLAVRNGYFDVAEILLLGGADANLKGRKGNSALTILCEEGNVDGVSFLLYRCHASLTSQNRENETPLFYAVAHFPVLDTIMKFCEKRFDNKQMVRLFSRTDSNNENLFHRCTAKGYLRSLTALVKILPDHVVQTMLNAKTKNHGYTPLHLATINSRYNMVHILCVSSEVDIDAQDNKGNTALHIAVVNKEVDIVQLLNEKGRSYTRIKNLAGKTADVLAKKNSVKLVDLVSESEYQLNQKSRMIHHNIDDYNYNYEAVLDDREAMIVFGAFLKPYGLGPLLSFKKKVAEYRDAVSRLAPEEVRDIALRMFHDLVGKNFLLIGQEPREKMANALQGNHVLKEDLFDEALFVVESRLKVLFEAFLCSDLFKAYASSKIDSLTTLGDYKPISYIKTTTTLIDLSASNDINKLDFELVLNLSQSSNRWKALSAPKSASCTASTSIDSFSLSAKSKPQKMQRCAGLLEYNVDEVLYTIANTRFKGYYDNNLSVDETIDLVFTPTIAYTVLLENFPAVWPVQNRDFVTYNSVLRTDSGGYMIVKKSTANQLVPERKGSVRAYCYQGWLLEPVGPNCTRYVHVYCYDMLAVLSMDSIWNVVMEKKALNMHRGLLKAMEESKKSGFKHEASCCLLSTLGYSLQKKTGENLVPSPQFVPKRSATTVESPSQQKNLVKRVSYVSRATREFTSGELTKIAEAAAKNNAALKVTGMLLHSAGTFYQVIEGKQEQLDPLLSKVFNDKRHTDIKIVKVEENLQEHERQFSNWHMNTLQIDAIDHFFTENMKTLIAGAYSSTADQEISDSGSMTPTLELMD